MRMLCHVGQLCFRGLLHMKPSQSGRAAVLVLLLCTPAQETDGLCHAAAHRTETSVCSQLEVLAADNRRRLCYVSRLFSRWRAYLRDAFDSTGVAVTSCFTHCISL